MKLRNKKTGEVQDSEKLFSCYESLKELSEYWEDYTPKQPIIKDEKIRKAVRAWAEAFKIEKVYFDAKMLRFYDRKSKFIISVGYPIIGIWDKKDGYTLAELCGEEEE